MDEQPMRQQGHMGSNTGGGMSWAAPAVLNTPPLPATTF